MEEIWADFERIVPGGMTHWQHPRFFAYFPANASPASMLAEQLVNAMACQGMLWQTSARRDRGRAGDDPVAAQPPWACPRAFWHDP
jgi:glutamate/tyrosine decarboxylase-like PLP-dependent enzyme